MIGWEDIGKRRFEEGEWTGVCAFLLAGRIWMGHGPLDSPWLELSNEPKNVLIGEGWDMGESGGGEVNFGYDSQIDLTVGVKLFGWHGEIDRIEKLTDTAAAQLLD